MTVVIRYEAEGRVDGEVLWAESGYDTILAGDDIEDGIALLDARAQAWGDRYSWKVRTYRRTARISDADEGYVRLTVEVLQDEDPEETTT